MTSPTGGKWLRKAYGGDQDRVATELLSNRIYDLLGAKVPQAGTQTVDGKVALAYPLEPGEEVPFSGDKTTGAGGDTKKRIALGKHYMIDALLANYDFVGMDDDNVIWNGDDPTRLDQGGTLFYRAQGKKKPFEAIPSEVWTLLTKGQAKRGVFVSEDSMRAQAEHIASVLTPDVIDKLVDQAPFQDTEMKEDVRKALEHRVAWMGLYGSGGLKIPIDEWTKP